MDGPFWVDLRAPHISADVASVTLAGTAKALVPIANLPILGSNYFGFVGKAVRMRLMGRITTGATPGNLSVSLWWGTGADANGTSLVTSAATAMTATQSNLSILIEFFIRCRAIGATGSLMVNGIMSSNVAVIASTLQPVMIPASAPAGTTVDLTQNFVLSPQALRSGSTAEAIQIHDFTYEALN